MRRHTVGSRLILRLLAGEMHIGLLVALYQLLGTLALLIYMAVALDVEELLILLSLSCPEEEEEEKKEEEKNMLVNF